MSERTVGVRDMMCDALQQPQQQQQELQAAPRCSSLLLTAPHRSSLLLAKTHRIGFAFHACGQYAIISKAYHQHPV